ncbi:MAG: glycosyltransferase family 87 protein [Hyphomicrobium sp.]
MPALTQSLATKLCAGLLTVYILMLLAFTGPSQGWPGLGDRPKETTDYVAIWTGGKLALEGRALAAYDWDQHKGEATAVLGAEPPGFLPWPYPPTFLAMAAVFALLPYGWSMLLWVAATTGAAALVAARITGAARGALWMTVSVAILYNAHVGQNGALSAALLGCGLLLLPTRPVLAGLALGLLSYKPHLGVLVPLVLVASGQWRAFASAAITVVALVAGSAIAFGPETWPAFIEQMGRMSAHIAAVPNPEKLQSVYGLMRCLGAAPQAALAMHALFAAAVAAGVTLLWRHRDVPYEAKAAALAASALLISPYVFVYDLVVLIVAQAFLLRAVVEGRFDEREVDGILLANALIAIFPAAGLPMGLAATLLLLTLVVRRLGGARSTIKLLLPARWLPSLERSFGEASA